MWPLLLFTILANAESEPQKKVEIPFDPPKLVYKSKHPKLGLFEVACKQRLVSPDQEVLFSYSFRDGKRKITRDLFQVNTFNHCYNYKFKLTPDLHLTMVAVPGRRNDEPGASITTVYNWRGVEKKFEPISRTVFSPFKAMQIKYKKLLDKAALSKAENLIVSDRKKIEAFSAIDLSEVQAICEDFHTAYKTYADNLYKNKNYSRAFEMYFSMKQKFGDPQTLFYDAKSKSKPIVLVCQTENSNTDQSEDRFYTFARRYLHKIEFVPFMLLNAEKNMKLGTSTSKEMAQQILKYVSYLLKSASNDYQLQYQSKLVNAWNELVQNNPDHPEYDRLIDEDAQLIFLLASIHSCKGIPNEVLKRIALKNDNKENLKEMTLVTADDYYDEGLEQSAVYEYKQFVMGKVLLKTCDQIPKVVFDRYFKFVKNQPYQN